MGKLILIIVLTMFSYAFSQDTLRGILVDKEDNQPIASVGLTINYKSDSIFIKTDFDGYFYFTNFNSDSLTFTIKKEGYKDFRSSILNKNLEHKLLYLKLEQLYSKDSIYVITPINKEQALRDIENNSVYLFLPNTLSSMPSRGEENLISKKYNFKYNRSAQNNLINLDPIEYNKVIFKYLDKKYGKKWRKEIRKDVIGLKK